VQRGVAALAAALVPPEHGGPPPREVVAAARELLSAMPAPAASGLGVAGAGLALAARLRHGRPLAELPADRRAALLGALERGGPLGVAALDAVKALVLLAWGAQDRRAEVLAVASAAPPSRPDPVLDVTDATAVPAVLRADAVVVGSGAGGAFAARELARTGRDVVVVEAGEHWDSARLRAAGPVERFAGLYVDGGATVAVGLPPILLPLGRAVGGTTVINSGTCYRPPEDVRSAWHADHGLALAAPGTLGPWLDDVEATIGVAPAASDVLGRNGELALAGARALGWTAAGPLRRNATGCRGACQCVLGCPNNAKGAMHVTALPQACAAGARIVARLRADRVVHRAGRAEGVVGWDAAGREVRVLAPLVVVAAGAIGSPPLLRRSGLGGHPRLGRGLSIHPALSVAGRFAEPVVAWRGVLQSAGVEEHHARDGVLLEATGTPPGMGSAVLPGVGRELIGRLAGAEHLATLGAMVADLPSGRVLGARRPVITYRLAARDAGRVRRAVELASRALLAAGAEEVEPGGGAPAVRDPAQLPAALDALDVRRLHLAAFHPTGTVAGGADPARHPADPHGRLRGARGVLVADGALLPSCPGVNPQISIMAVAAAAAAAAA
jgi:choline dehydrogenase-like flavoprotein